MDLYQRKLMNQKLSLKEFDESRLELASRPSKIIIELNKYELWKHAKKPVNPMSLSLFKKAAAELFDDAYFVDLRGFETEAFEPHTHAVLDHLKHYPLINWHLFTHLTLGDQSLWPKIGDLGFMLGFACDGISRESVSAIRPTTDFDLMMQNIEHASQSIARSGRGFIYMIVSIQRENMHELPGLIELAHRNGIHQVQFKVMDHFSDEAARSGSLPELIGASLDLALKYGIRLSINDQEHFEGVEIAKIVRAIKTPIPDPVLNFPPAADLEWQRLDIRVIDRARVSVYKNCFKPYHYAHIASDGRVGTCNHMLDPTIVEMGDLNEQSFGQIWNGQKYQEFRRDLLAARPSDPRCQWCFKHRLTD